MAKKGKRVVGDEMRMSDALWERIEPFLPLEVTGPKGGRPWMSPRSKPSWETAQCPNRNSLRGCVWTKAMTILSSRSWWRATDTQRTYAVEARSVRRNGPFRDTAPAVGWWSAVIVG